MKSTGGEGRAETISTGSDGGGVAEFQGLFGPYVFPERLLQEIWRKRDFDVLRARTTDGRPVQVLDPGRWNRLGGPDFKDARLRLGGEERFGDVEVHLRAADWRAHGHDSDLAYDRVILHVVLFPGDASETPLARGGHAPVLALLPLLRHDLEEYAADDVLGRLAASPQDRAVRELAALDLLRLGSLLRRKAGQRWHQKVHYARLRLARLGWEDACHHTALEILGYRFNRAPMLAAAAAFPLGDWVRGGAAERVHRGFETRWARQGARPANHPRRRLQQYENWVAARPTWPEELLRLGSALPEIPWPEDGDIASVRRTPAWRGLASQIADAVLGGQVGGSRRHTLVCDGFLPLLAAAGEDNRCAGVWYAWWPGDLPASVRRLSSELALAGRIGGPHCHGVAQGLLGWLLAPLDTPRAAHLPSNGRRA